MSNPQPMPRHWRPDTDQVARLARAAFSVGVVVAAMLIAAPPSAAQPGPDPEEEEEEDDGRRIIRPGARTTPPPVIRPGGTPRGLEPRRDLIPSREVVTGDQPGVVDTSTDSPRRTFDPDRDDAVPADDLPTDVEDVIEWKTNFEQGIKCKKLPLNAKVRLDFNEITLGDLTKFISCITEQNFILTGGTNKNATVSILSPKPVTAYEAYKAYLSALEANGLTVVPNGRFLEIVPSAEGRTQGAPIYGATRNQPNTDQIVTRLVQLDHIPIDEIQPVIDKFRTKSSDVTLYRPTNTIIITDTGSNIRRILKLIKDLDVPTGKERIWIRPIVHMNAAELAQLLEQIIGGQSGGQASGQPARPVRRTARQARQQAQAQATATAVGEAPSDIGEISITKMIPDERTNSIIFVATRTAYLQTDKIIRKLDVPIPGEGAYHIHALENADAEELAQTLTSLVSGSSSARQQAGGAPGQPVARGTTAARGAGGSTAALFQGEVKITSYEPTNSLLIEASLADYLSLQKVIRQLDVQRKQVYVEAIIMEISQTKTKDLGFSGSGGATFDVDGNTVPLLFGVGGLGLDATGALETLSAGGGAIGLQGPIEQVEFGSDQGSAAGSFSLPLFGFTLRALASTINVNVLSTPHILTLENEEAEIQVGRRQPYQTSGLGGIGSLTSLLGSAGGAGGANLGGLGALGGLAGLGGLGNNVQYVDVDLTLKIKPQVNASNFVRLEIDQSIDDIDGFLEGTGAPITSKRKVTNVVVVRDGQPVVIGGLIRDQETESVSKVPFLGDIPLLGLLFRSTKTTVEKRNLLMIIIPHVINDPSDLKRIYEQRREEYRELATVLAERRKEYEGQLDYRKKSGILHDIHETINRAKKERELRERALFQDSQIDRVGDPLGHDIEFDPREQLEENER